VLGPGSNVYHYDHLHLDLAKHGRGHHTCSPEAIPGEIAAGVRTDRMVTGSIRSRKPNESSKYLSYDSESRPGGSSEQPAIPGED
jgi:hypothetical protein